jgi:hypothetical protein
MTPESKNAILNSKGLWPKAKIPYIISASYSERALFKKSLI